MKKIGDYTLEEEGEGIALLYKGEFVRYFCDMLYCYQNIEDAEKYIREKEEIRVPTKKSEYQNISDEIIEFLNRIDELEKENKRLKEELKCAETNFLTCNADLAALGDLVGGSCYDHTYDLVKRLVDNETPKKPK